MTSKDVIAKIAEAKYQQRMRIKDEFDIGGGDADGDWLWAERAIKFFEDKNQDPIWDAYHVEEYMWVYPLYIQLTEPNRKS